MKEYNNSPIKSNFDPNEEFDYYEVPQHFKSVTGSCIRNIKTRCARHVYALHNGDYPSSALEASLKGVDGSFDPAFAQLDGDYSTRKANLEAAYNDGLAGMHGELLEFEKEIDAHDRLFAEYAQAVEQVTGRRPVDLSYSNDKLNQFRKQYKKLEEKN